MNKTPTLKIFALLRAGTNTEVWVPHNWTKAGWVAYRTKGKAREFATYDLFLTKRYGLVEAILALA